jgi:hypothetical protein
MSDPVVFHADLVLAIEPLEPANGEMAMGHVLEVVCTENPIRVDDVMESPKLAE